MFLGFPHSSYGKESACNAGDLGLEDPLEKGMPTPVFLPGESQGRLAWWAVIYGMKFNSYQILLYTHSVKLFQMLILLA